MSLKVCTIDRVEYIIKPLSYRGSPSVIRYCKKNMWVFT